MEQKASGLTPKDIFAEIFLGSFAFSHSKKSRPQGPTSLSGDSVSEERRITWEECLHSTTQGKVMPSAMRQRTKLNSSVALLSWRIFVVVAGLLTIETTSAFSLSDPYRLWSAREWFDESNTTPSTHRRILVGGFFSVSSTIFATTTAGPSPANAALFSGRERRQLELCLVAVQRVVYWAQNEVDALRAATSTEQSKTKYLEVRLGAKALLTGKIGGGATSRVYTLASLQLPGCLQDLEWQASQQQQSSNKSLVQQVSENRRTFSEGLASIVEFDGLETLIDPSPRSSLTLSQYNDDKALYVRRALEELVIPAGNQLLKAFGPEPLQRSLGFVQQYYSTEIYPPQPTASSPTTEQSSESSYDSSKIRNYASDLL